MPACVRCCAAAPEATPRRESIGTIAFEIDLNRRLVRRDGEIVQLSRTEWMLLQHLALNPGKIMLNAELLHRVWGAEYSDDLQYLRVWISRIRRKIEADPAEPEAHQDVPGRRVYARAAGSGRA